ncbi:MAG: hypothetical protein JSV32_05465 [Dehalococcoidia bacterium]|nr:MAG: hypothetical protein JSV32_05465 [Dehalococcoidia bacterium]
MNTLKIFVLIFSSLFLILSLFLFGFLFSMKMTALSEGYINSRLECLPLEPLIDDLEFDETIERNPELVNLIRNVVIDNEAELKERTSEMINSVYDYLNGKSEDLDMASVLKDTILDPDFSISIIQQADLTLLVKELVFEMTKDTDIPYGLSLESHIDNIVLDLEPWLEEQVTAGVPIIYDYILGFRQDTGIVIQLDPVTEMIRNSLRQDFLNSPPAEFTGLPRAELEQKFDEVFNEIAGNIWSAIVIDMELMESDIQSDVAKSITDAEDALSESRKYIGIFNIVYNLLIALIVLLIASIVLIYREVKIVSRVLAGIFLGYGAINLIIISITRAIARDQIAKIDDIPASIQTWIGQSVTDSLTPLFVLSIVLLIIGVALLVASFVYKRSQPQTGTII